LQLLELLMKLFESNAKPKFSPSRIGDIQNSVASVERMKTVLGYVPGWPLERGLRELCESLV